MASISLDEMETRWAILGYEDFLLVHQSYDELKVMANHNIVSRLSRCAELFD
jgi:hypothetical protein